MPWASSSVIAPDPGELAPPGHRRLRPLGHREGLGRLVGEGGAEVVGQDHLHVDALGPERVDEAGRGGGEATDSGDGSEFGSCEEHTHRPKYCHSEPDRRGRVAPGRLTGAGARRVRFEP